MLEFLILDSLVPVFIALVDIPNNAVVKSRDQLVTGVLPVYTFKSFNKALDREPQFPYCEIGALRKFLTDTHSCTSA